MNYLEEIISNNKIIWNSPMDVAIRNDKFNTFQYSINEKNNQIPEILGNNKDLLSAYLSQHFEFIKKIMKKMEMLLEIII